MSPVPISTEWSPLGMRNIDWVRVIRLQTDPIAKTDTRNEAAKTNAITKPMTRLPELLDVTRMIIV
jgi:hypothetical protein